MKLSYRGHRRTQGGVVPAGATGDSSASSGAHNRCCVGKQPDSGRERARGGVGGARPERRSSSTTTTAQPHDRHLGGRGHAQRPTTTTATATATATASSSEEEAHLQAPGGQVDGARDDHVVCATWFRDTEVWGLGG
jgi:hypothetical protein